MVKKNLLKNSCIRISKIECFVAMQCDISLLEKIHNRLSTISQLAYQQKVLNFTYPIKNSIKMVKIPFKNPQVRIQIRITSKT